MYGNWKNNLKKLLYKEELWTWIHLSVVVRRGEMRIVCAHAFSPRPQTNNGPPLGNGGADNTIVHFQQDLNWPMPLYRKKSETFCMMNCPCFVMFTEDVHIDLQVGHERIQCHRCERCLGILAGWKGHKALTCLRG